MRKNTPNKIAALCLSLTLLMAGGVSGAVSAGAADGSRILPSPMMEAPDQSSPAARLFWPMRVKT